LQYCSFVDDFKSNLKLYQNNIIETIQFIFNFFNLVQNNNGVKKLKQNFLEKIGQNQEQTSLFNYF